MWVKILTWAALEVTPMTIDILGSYDRRAWGVLQRVPQSDGFGMVELVPSGVQSLRPDEIIVFRTEDKRQATSSLEEDAIAHVAALRAATIDGKLEYCVIAKQPDHILYLVRIIDDMRLGNVFWICRRDLHVDRSLVLTYERHGHVKDDDLLHWSKWGQSLAQKTIFDLAHQDFSTISPAATISAFHNIKKIILSADPKVSRQFAEIEAYIESIPPPIPQTLEYYIGILSVISTLVNVRDLDDIIPNVGCLNDLIIAAQAVGEIFRKIGNQDVLRLCLSMQARFLSFANRDDLFDSEYCGRAMRIARFVCQTCLNDNSSRSEESAHTFAQTSAALAARLGRNDAAEDCEWLYEPLRSRPFSAARVAARILDTTFRAPIADRSRAYLELLNRADIAITMVDNLDIPPFSDSFVFPTATEDASQLHDFAAQLSAEEILGRCPLEFQVNVAEQQDALWLPNKAPFSLLRMIAHTKASEFQVGVYGMKEPQRDPSKARMRALAQNSSLLFLRSFRSFRRVWLHNQFNDSYLRKVELRSAELPRLLTIESALHIGLLRSFVLVAMGGLPDPYGMGRMSMEGGHWHMAFSRYLDIHGKERPLCILILPDRTEGLSWEVGEISRRQLLGQTAFVMLPSDLDDKAEQIWTAFRTSACSFIPTLPTYSRSGGFVTPTHDLSGCVTHPFNGLWSGHVSEVLRGLVTKS